MTDAGFDSVSKDTLQRLQAEADARGLNIDELLKRTFPDTAARRGRRPATGLLPFPKDDEPPSERELLQSAADVSLPFTFADLFCGIGGLRLGLESVGGRCVMSCDSDPHVARTYQAWYGDSCSGDITELSRSGSIPDHDVLAAGFPCQPFSIAGVSKKKSLGRAHGFRDRTQGTLFFHLAEIIDRKQPPVLLLENVKNLRSHDKGQTWTVICSTLAELGYTVFDHIIDAGHYVPQHRERVFIVGFRRDVFGDAPQFSFPEPPSGIRPRLRDILQRSVDPKYTLSDKLWEYLQAYAEKHRRRGNGFGCSVADLNGTTRTLSARYHKDGSEILIPGRDGANPRRLTPTEAGRLMGFPDRLLAPGRQVVSDTQMYRQFGNSVSPPVAEAVARSLIPVMAEALIRKNRNGCLLKGRNRRRRRIAQDRMQEFSGKPR